jgi:transketolase
MAPSESLKERSARLEEIVVEVRAHIIDMIYTARSGHPGSSLSTADIMTALYFDLARVDPRRPEWPDRDRVILSKGHGCPVWYACLALKGYFPLEVLKTLRRFESMLQGHPDMRKTPGVDMTTGSLGHGLSLGVGMALEGRLRAADYTVYVILGDGEVQEGQVWEAAASAAKYGLDNLVAVVDRNRLQMDGFTDRVMPMEPLDAKFRAFNWQVMRMDGHDMKQILTTLGAAREVKDSPVCVLADTVKGKGVSFMENVRVWHGKCPNKAEYEQAMREIRGGRA